MKRSNIKIIVVKLNKTEEIETEVNGDIFDDPFLEAATQALERSTKVKRYGLVLPILECWEKNKKRTKYLYNTYWILVNASMYAKAEVLREKFKMQFNVDLSNEPMKGDKLI